MSRIKTDWGKFAQWMNNPVDGILQHADDQEIEFEKLNAESQAVVVASTMTTLVCSGGVSKLYIESLALDAPEMFDMDMRMSKHGGLAELAEFGRRMLEPLKENDELLAQARSAGSWPESFFEDTQDLFEKIETDIYKKQRALSAQVIGHILQNPHVYYEIETPVDWVEGFSGALDYSYGTGKQRFTVELKFENGFPYGPNITNHPNSLDLVRTMALSTDRSILCERTVSNDSDSANIEYLNLYTGKTTRPVKGRDPFNPKARKAIFD